jgi:hypothetical protein
MKTESRNILLIIGVIPPSQQFLACGGEMHLLLDESQ